MVLQADGGGGASPQLTANVQQAAGQVTMVIDEVKRIAQHTLEQLSTDAHAGKRSFADIDTDPGQFGHVPKAQQLAEHHAAAHQVFVDTYQGIISDLVAFRDNLLACADAHEKNDEQVQAALLALSNRYHGHHFRADAAYDHGRTEQGQHLGGATPPAAVPTASAGPAPAPAAPTTAPTAPEGPSAPAAGTSDGSGRSM